MNQTKTTPKPGVSLDMKSNFRAVCPSIALFFLPSLLLLASCGPATPAGKGPTTGAVAPGDPLILGRKLYFTKCADCHVAEPVKRYSAAEWAHILPDMAEEAKLSPSETAAVRAYVKAELAR